MSIRRVVINVVARLMLRFSVFESAIVGCGRRWPNMPGYWRIARYYPLLLRSYGKDVWRWAKSIDGVWMYVDAADRMHGKFWYRYLHYEQSTSSFIKEHLKPDDVFIDVGANMGYFTLMAADIVGSEGKVLAFEPNPALANAVNMSLIRNGFAERAVVSEIALSDSISDSKDFFLSADPLNSGLSSLSEAWAKSNSVDAPARICITCTTLDEWIEQNPMSRIDMVKIDVEGAEAACLRGMKAVLESYMPGYIICETFDRSEAHQFLEQMGYQGERSEDTLNGIYRRIV